jgi:N-acetylmuramoyl-L-alanine amidase
MKLYEVIQTKNASYIRARPIKPVGIFVHSTGATNPELRRYVEDPDLLGFNQYDNHWNVPDSTKSMHAFIGKDKNGDVAVCHTLPYDIACWGAGGGSRGSYNYDPQAHVQFEVCEDNAPRSGKPPTPKETAYFNAAWLAAEEYCAYLCQLLNLPASSIVGHYEAAKRGFASYHSDPEPWMKKFGDSMDKFRSRVAERLKGVKIKLTRQENADFYSVPIGTVIDFDMETYLLGVVPAEIGNAPIEACKAQAVAARTYATRRLGQAIDDTTAYQAYRAPRSADKAYTNAHEGVRLTQGQILTYGGAPIDAVYSHSNGGKTVSAEEKWGNAIPYLLSRFDPWTTEEKNGHGVGLSQMGAVRSAEMGVGYRDILKFYYPGTSLSGEPEESVAVSYKATVNTKNPLSLNLWADTNKSKSLKLIPRWDVVAVLSEVNPTWAVIEHGGMQGYADRQYLVKVDDPPAPEPIDNVALIAELESIADRLKVIANAFRR